MMTTQQIKSNLEIARRFLEEFIGKNNQATADDTVDDAIEVSTGLKTDGPIRGREQYKQIIDALFGAFPDMDFNLTDLFPSADGEKVVGTFTASGTHLGEMYGIAPTKRRITMTETHVLTFRGGKIIHNLVGGNNPLEFEMLFAPVLAPLVLPGIEQTYRAASETEKQNLAISLKFFNEFLGKGDLSVAEEVLDESVQAITGLKPNGPIDGSEEYKQIFSGFFEAFPPVSPLEIEDIFAVDDRVVCRFRSVQKHAKDYFGIAATMREIVFIETHVQRLKDGKIIENVVSATNLEFEMLMAPVLAPMILK